MTRDEYLARKAAGEPIESARELVHALNEVRARIGAESPEWFLMNRCVRMALDFADAQERAVRMLLKDRR